MIKDLEVRFVVKKLWVEYQVGKIHQVKNNFLIVSSILMTFNCLWQKFQEVKTTDCLE